MDAVSAVVTTGIYCVPGCTAQPLAKNVTRYPTAAAAEAAGYRACLRCRPYRQPPVSGTIQPELVCRGVQLILNGALDQGTEAAVADRLGVSARHLRRLFVTELGVTPDGLARSARAHFARRLLDETDLTITEVAFAAGFGSQRQFNRICREIFRASPTELRARRRRSDRLAADGGLALRLAYRGPLDWAAIVALLARTAIPGVEHVDGDIYRRTVSITGNPGVLEILPGGEDHLVLRAHLPRWRELLHVVRRARRIAGLDSDPYEAGRQLGRDPVLGPLVRARPGLRVPGTWDGFETGVRALVARGSAGAAATAALARLVERHGAPAPGLRELGLTHTFPGPEVLANVRLAGLGIAPDAAAAIRTFSHAAAVDAIRLDPGASLDELAVPIDALPGVGPMVAQYIALRLGEPDAFPVSDSQLADHLAALQSRPSRQTRAALVDQWRPWRALAVTHLWVATGLVDAAVQRGAA